MTVSVTVVPSAPRATIDHTHVTVDDADQNDITAYDTTSYPTSPELRYYLSFEEGGEEWGRSYVFGVGETGGHEFNNYIFPHDGSWTVHLRDESDDSSVANAAVTVS